MLLHDPAITAVLFDVDGTLIDSVDAHAQSWTEALRVWGHDVPFEAVRRQIGKGGDQLLPVFLSREEIERVGDELEAYRGRLFKQRYLPHLKAFPEVRALFERLIADGKRIGLASSAQEDELAQYKKIADIGDLIGSQTAADDAERSKPHPDIFQAALAKLGHPDPASVVVVGDTPYDAEAAGKAKLRSIGVLRGGWPERELYQAGCSMVVRDPAALLTHYAENAGTRVRCK
jgi:HAD superfamily hydrolase (TIGR01549 family)